MPPYKLSILEQSLVCERLNFTKQNKPDTFSESMFKASLTFIYFSFICFDYSVGVEFKILGFQ
jgi:hypothetical protein